MNRRVAAFFLACLSTFLYAQEVTTLDEPVARQNLVTDPEPIYPPIAKAAHVSGNVALEIQVDASGHVSATKVLSGPPMLRGAAIDAVKTWEFKPFQKDGQPVSATTKITIPFSLGTPDANDEQIASVYFPLSQTCIKLVGQRADSAEQARACKAAAAEAQKFGQDTRFIERRSSYVYCATALMRNKEYKDALACADKAVIVVQQGHDDGSGSSAAYAVRGQTEAFGGDLLAADGDLTRAEHLQRDALDTPAGHALSKQYVGTLKNLLSFHAQVLQALNRKSEADAKLEEASKL